jgi:hypothetical protein
MHLLTKEAFQTYRRHLSPNGLLLVHISNRYLDLRPVIAANIRDGWNARARYFAPSPAETKLWQSGSLWIALSPSPSTLARLEQASGGEKWTSLRPRPGFHQWTDDYASILPIIKWGK